MSVINWPAGMKDFTVPYVEGWYAFGTGRTEESCRFDKPEGRLDAFPIGRARRDWHRGWRDAKEAGFVHVEPVG